MTRSTERGTAARAPQDQEREASFFDGLVAECGDFNPFAERGWRTLARKFAACIGEPRKLEILEIGCGTGHSRRLYTQFAKAYVGVDLSRASLRLGRIQHPGDALLCADACRLPLRDASFDVVAFSSLLHHVPDYSLPLLEAHRVLRSDGLAFSFDPNVWHPAMALFRHPRSPLYTAQGVSPNERPLSRAPYATRFAMPVWKSCICGPNRTFPTVPSLRDGSILCSRSLTLEIGSGRSWAWDGGSARF